MRAWVPTICLSAALLGPSSAAPASAGHVLPFYHVRSAERPVVELLRRGYARSATFRALVEAVEDTDVIVYVQPTMCLPPPARAWVQFAGVAGRFRFLRVSFLGRTGADGLSALIGHELQHVLEVGRAAEVRSTTAFEAFFRAAGRESVNGFETETARLVGLRIEDELQRAAGEDTTGR